MARERGETDWSDAELVELAREGDAEAFGRLVRRHLPAAEAAALAVIGERADAEDICQDAFISALRHLERCRPADKFRPWLLAIVRNRALDLRRRQKVRAAEPLDAAEAAGLATEGSGSGSPLRDAERADVGARLGAALERLTDVRREVVLLHDLEGWTHREIASHLGLAEGTTRAHLFWARRRLREILGGTLDEGESK